jgi:hypothetical protein
MSTAETMLKLALRLAERGDAEGAAEALRGVLAMRAEPQPNATQLVSQKVLASILGCSGRHVRDLEARGQLPEDACIGSGKAKRYIVPVVLAALGKRVVAADPIADEARADMQRRSQLRALPGGAS